MLPLEVRASSTRRDTEGSIPPARYFTCCEALQQRFPRGPITESNPNTIILVRHDEAQPLCPISLQNVTFIPNWISRLYPALPNGTVLEIMPTELVPIVVPGRLKLG